jgi:hypothetical protein
VVLVLVLLLVVVLLLLLVVVVVSLMASTAVVVPSTDAATAISLLPLFTTPSPFCSKSGGMLLPESSRCCWPPDD